MWVFDVTTRQARLLIKSKIFSSSMFIAFQEVRNSHEGPSLRCIQILYGGYGHNVIKELRTNDQGIKNEYLLVEINGIGDRRSEDTKLEFMFSNMNIHKLRLLSTHKTILFRYLFI
ncbi:hypothetical protein Ccrd_022427 [Cynara cardunculus var. scolymus]|uniref:Uncharacterized protein n=1 Tax=Cynara cardunculus var. scolymus TaxID=59895 RepID=A0A103XYQ9_CYNCS|nr:hypothetical protein Ccrd_022427 [Cynara cardunculus var. scolymus]